MPEAAAPRLTKRVLRFECKRGELRGGAAGVRNDKHPDGLANRSGQVGWNFMYHQGDALLALSTDRNADSYTKTWGTNDFYLRDSDRSILIR